MNKSLHEKLDICSKCDQLQVKSVLTCKMCGCVIKLKVLIPNSKCPKGSW